MPAPVLMEHKSIAVRLGAGIKDVDVKQGIVCAYGSSFNVVDDNYPIPDVVKPAAFKKAILENGPSGTNRVKNLWQHNKDMILGVPSMLLEDGFGLYYESKIIRTSFGNDVLLLYEAGAINEHSIGYFVVKSSYGDVKGEKVRFLEELGLLEVSACTWGMNSITPTVGIKGNQDAIDRLAAQLTRVQSILHNGNLQTPEIATLLQKQSDEWELLLKAVQPPPPARERITTAQEFGDMNKEDVEALVQAEVRKALATKDATGKTTWPLADRDTAWDSGEAHKRIVDWATKADGSYDEGKLESVHFYSPGGDGGQKLGGYKLAFCDVSDGKVHAIPNAIIACYGSHGVDATKGIEEGDKDAIKKKISTYCAAMRKKFDNPDGFVPAWEEDDKKARRGPMARKDYRYLLARPDYALRLKQQMAAGRKDFQGAMVSEDLQQMWADAWNALALSLLRDMADAIWGPIGGGEKPDAKETIGTDFDQAKAYFLELAAKSVAAGFVPASDCDGDGFYNPAADDDDDDDDYAMMSARLRLASKEGKVISAANHKALSAAHGKIEEGLKEAKALMTKMKPSKPASADEDEEADTSDDSPDNENPTKQQSGAGAKSITTGAPPAGAKSITTPGNDELAVAFNDIFARLRPFTGDSSNGHGS